MDYKKIAISPAVVIGAAGLFAATATFAQTAEIGTWSGFRKGAVSFTFDDGAPSHVSDAGPLFNKYGYKATFNLVYNWGPDWSGFQKLADGGHEIASHSNSHGNNMSGEEASSKQNINGKIKQKYGIITVAYPNCNVPNESAVLQNYIVGRICNSGNSIVGKDGPSNWARVPAIMTGPNGSNDFKGPMGSVVNSNSWVSFLTHGFSGKNNGSATYSPTDIGLIEDALKYAQQNDKDIWVAPMGHVAMYLKERKASKAEASSNGGNITVKLTHSIKDNISDYDYPLSIRVKYDGSKAEVTQAGAKLESKIDGGYVYFDAVPNAGDIVISGEGGGTSQPTESSSSSAPSSAASSSSNPGTKVSSSSHHHGSHHDSSSSSGTPVSSSSTGPALSSSSNGFDAIVATEFDSNPASAYVDASGYITVINAQGMNITVFNSLGKVVRTTKGLGCLQKVYSGAKGVYIVRIGNKAKTVSIK
ncbi:MAG: polysaccharide deacetylase family protein [Fibrobacter sp.]|nr:polysaccharide deacetylase family protein [Fibrobacter sp.]